MSAPTTSTQQSQRLLRFKTPEESIPLSEVVSALSFALDLTEDAVPGHAIRSCLIGMRIGQKLGLEGTALAELYYALLLKDIGCSSNSARMCHILGGDDRKAKKDVKVVDWTRPSLSGLKLVWDNALPTANPFRKSIRILQLIRDQDRNNAEMIGIRCERGADIVRKIGLSTICADAVHSLDEHWNGSGYPDCLRGESIPLFARILCLAQHLDVFNSEQGRLRAVATMRERSGTWFDPELVRIALALDRTGELWAGCNTPTEHESVLALEPGSGRVIDGVDLDCVCEAFADVVDAKSPFTYRHSIGVTAAADGISRHLDLSPVRRQLIHRAALLHDVGKLSVSNSILDKPGKLDDNEWTVVRDHPLLSQRILERIPNFSSIARIAGRHHGKLDGTGYPHRISGSDLTLEDRIVATADIYGALSEDRPYRLGLGPEEILDIFRKDVPQKLDGDCFEALQCYMEETRPAASASAA